MKLSIEAHIQVVLEHTQYKWSLFKGQMYLSNMKDQATDAIGLQQSLAVRERFL